MPKNKKLDEIDIPSFNSILQEFNRKHGKNTLDMMDKMELDIQRIPTGITVFDNAIGGGLPKGRIVDFYGVPSSGKSLVSLQAIKKAQELGLSCTYFDVEHALDPEFAKRVGVDISKLAISRVSLGEEVMDMVVRLLDSSPGIIVVDSVAALVTRSELEESLDQKFMAPKARLMANALKKINNANKETVIIFINQLRSSMALYGPPTYPTGGRALDHEASLRVEVSKGDKITIDGKATSEIIGQVIKFRITKTKVSLKPEVRGSFKFYYEDGRIE